MDIGANRVMEENANNQRHQDDGGEDEELPETETIDLISSGEEVSYNGISIFPVPLQTLKASKELGHQNGKNAKKSTAKAKKRCNAQNSKKPIRI